MEQRGMGCIMITCFRIVCTAHSNFQSSKHVPALTQLQPSYIRHVLQHTISLGAAEQDCCPTAIHACLHTRPPNRCPYGPVQVEAALYNISSPMEIFPESGIPLS